MPRHTPVAGKPQPRKGEMTRDRILECAADLGSVDGLESVTIGRLATEIGMSKSGLYAHFGSKEGLQIEVIEWARARYQDLAMKPGQTAPKGLAQIERTLHDIFAFLERRVFPGGCFMNKINAEFHARPGTIRDNIREGKSKWRARIATMARDAQRNGEFRRDLDVEQFAFELDAMINFVNWSLDDKQAVSRAKRSIEAAVERAKA